MGNPVATSSVAPVCTMSVRHAAAIPAVDGAFGVPEGTVAFTVLVGTPALQFAAVDQFESTLPFQVVVCAPAKLAPATRVRSNRNLSRKLSMTRFLSFRERGCLRVR